MLPKNFFSHIFKYLALSLIEKFGLALVIGGFLLSSWKGVELIPLVINFFHSLLPFLFDSLEISGNFSLGSNYSLFHNIATISRIGIPMVGIFMFLGLLWDIVRYTFQITGNTKTWARNHKILVLLFLFILSLSGNFYLMSEHGALRSIMDYIGVIFLGIVSFVYFMIIAIGPGFLIYIYTPIGYTQEDEEKIRKEKERVKIQEFLGAFFSAQEKVQKTGIDFYINAWIDFFEDLENNIPPELIRANMNNAQVEKMKQDLISPETTEKEKKFLKKILINDLRKKKEK